MTDTAEFDPGTHTVEEVQAHLAEASPEEQERVLQAERDGKARKTILGPAAEDAADPDVRDDVTRCGGYVLTNEGWVLDGAGAEVGADVQTEPAD